MPPWWRDGNNAVPIGSGASLDPAKQLSPVVLVSAYVFRVVIEDALTERRQQDVRLRVAKFRNHGKRGALAEFGDRGLAGIGPWFEAVADQGDRELAPLHPGNGLENGKEVE